MQIVSVEFACFFLVVLSLGLVMRPRPLAFKSLLLLASYGFYACFSPWFALLLAVVSALSYGAGVALAALKTPSGRSTVLAAYLGVVLGNLCFFKYSAMLAELLGFGGALDGMDLALPVGISFFTFQGIGYVVDVHRDQGAAQRSWLDVFVFLAFFPTLLSGPILRAGEFIPQLSAPAPEPGEAGQAFWLIVLGLFKKITLSSYLSEHITRQLFSAPEGFSSLGAVVGAAAYSAQIYCDFSGYSDLAQGMAGLLGLRVPDNFNQPYAARNLRDFWRRWHISLSTWLRDYLYIPLGGSRVGSARRTANLLVTMCLGGLWHGANVTFLAWGGLHGLGLVAVHALGGKADAPKSRWRDVLNWAATFGFVTLAWVFFASPDFATALTVFERMVVFQASGTNPGFVLTAVVVAVIGVQAFGVRGLGCCPDWMRALPAPALGAVVGVLGAVIVRLGPDGMLPFIYFAF